MVAVSAATSKGGHLQDGPTAVRPTYRLIQVLRAVAALMVVFHHETLMMWDRLRVATVGHNWVEGAAGVDIFFIISGFVMTISSAPLVGTRHPARTFLARRLERVVPMYWLLTTLKVLLILALPSDSANGLVGWKHVMASYLFLPVRVGEPVLVVGWTLTFEMAFYALFALALRMRVRPITLLGPVSVAVVAYCRLATPSRTPFQIFLRYYGDYSMVLEFVVGMLLALALPWVKRLPVWLAAACALLPWYWLFRWGSANWSHWRVFGWGGLAFLIVLGALALEEPVGRLTPRWLLELGDASYSIYLTHGFVLPVCAAVLLRLPQGILGAKWVILAALLALSALVGDLVYRLVELPITRWFKGRRRTAVPAVG